MSGWPPGLTAATSTALCLTAYGWPIWAVAVVAGLTGFAVKEIWEA